jgi:hypothetical protein
MWIVLVSGPNDLELGLCDLEPEKYYEPFQFLKNS